MTEHDRVPQSEAQSEPGSPVLLILLGASNLARGYIALVEFIRRQLAPRPVEVLAAFGPGRGYCAWGGILGQIKYPPIGSSVLFKKAEVQARTAHSVHALVTDIGNDILYGVDPEQIIETITGVQERLLQLNAHVTTTTLPSYFEQEIPSAVFYAIRTFLFPSSRIPPEQVREAVIRINEFLRTPGDERIHLLSSLDSYISWDRVHYSLLRGHEAWTRVGRHILEQCGRPPQGHISFPQMVLSYEQHLSRLLFMDLLKIRRRDPHLF